MRIYTAYLRDGAPPELVREGFSWGAFFFGPLWFALHRAWIAVIIDVVLFTLAGLVHGPRATVLSVGLMVLQGMFANDLRRGGLARRRFMLVHVVAALDRDSALARLLALRPDLSRSLAR